MPVNLNLQVELPTDMVELIWTGMSILKPKCTIEPNVGAQFECQFSRQEAKCMEEARSIKV